MGHSSKFQRVSRLGFVTAATSLTGGQPNFAQCLAVSLAGTLYIRFRGLLPPREISPGAKFTLRPSLAFSHIDSVTVTARHSSSGRESNCGVQQRRQPIFGGAAITLAIGPHSSFCLVCISNLIMTFVRIVCRRQSRLCTVSVVKLFGSAPKYPGKFECVTCYQKF